MGERQEGSCTAEKSESQEEKAMGKQADMGGLLATRGRGEVLAGAAAKGHVRCSSALPCCPWLLVSPKAVHMPRVWVTTWGHVSVQRLCHHRGHPNLSHLCCYLVPW